MFCPLLSSIERIYMQVEMIILKACGSKLGKRHVFFQYN